MGERFLVFSFTAVCVPYYSTAVCHVVMQILDIQSIEISIYEGVCTILSMFYKFITFLSLNCKKIFSVIFLFPRGGNKGKIYVLNPKDRKNHYLFTYFCMVFFEMFTTQIYTRTTTTTLSYRIGTFEWLLCRFCRPHVSITNHTSSFLILFAGQCIV